MALKPAYSLRFIGVEDGHREIVRVDRSGPNGAVRIVPEAELQARRRRAYFRDTINLAADEIYVSPLHLNAENGVVETPHVPTLLIAKPVMAPDGKPFGIVIINVDMRPALDRVRSSVRPGEKVYVVDGKGDYLVHPDRCARIRLAAGQADRLAERLPVSGIVARRDAGVAQSCRIEAGRPGGIALAPAILAGSEWVAVIETVPNAVFMAPAASDPEHLAAGRIDRGAVRGGAGAVDREIADPADHPIDRSRPGRRPATARPPFRSMRAARPACWRARLRR